MSRLAGKPSDDQPCRCRPVAGRRGRLGIGTATADHRHVAPRRTGWVAVDRARLSRLTGVLGRSQRCGGTRLRVRARHPIDASHRRMGVRRALRGRVPGRRHRGLGLLERPRQRTHCFAPGSLSRFRSSLLAVYVGRRADDREANADQGTTTEASMRIGRLAGRKIDRAQQRAFLRVWRALSQTGLARAAALPDLPRGRASRPATPSGGSIRCARTPSITYPPRSPRRHQVCVRGPGVRPRDSRAARRPAHSRRVAERHTPDQHLAAAGIGAAVAALPDLPPSEPTTGEGLVRAGTRLRRANGGRVRSIVLRCSGASCLPPRATALSGCGIRRSAFAGDRLGQLCCDVWRTRSTIKRAISR